MHQLLALLVICGENPSVTIGLPSKRARNHVMENGPFQFSRCTWLGPTQSKLSCMRACSFFGVPSGFGYRDQYISHILIRQSILRLCTVLGTFKGSIEIVFHFNLFFFLLTGWVTHINVNVLSHHWSVQTMARRLFGDKPLSQPIVTLVNWTLVNNFSKNLDEEHNGFDVQNAFKNSLQNIGHLVSVSIRRIELVIE